MAIIIGVKEIRKIISCLAKYRMLENQIHPLDSTKKGRSDVFYNNSQDTLLISQLVLSNEY